MDWSFLTIHDSTAVWAAFSAAISGVGAWFLSLRNINSSVERTRIKVAAEASAAEAAERAAFRATLMAEVSAMRLLVKECEDDRNVLRSRLNAAEGQILILQASNEIMERWVTFFKDRSSALQVTTLGDSTFSAAT